MLNAPLAPFVRLGPRSANSACRLFAVNDVALRAYLRWGRDNAFGTASRTMRCKLRASVATAFAEEALEPVEDAMDV